METVVLVDDDADFAQSLAAELGRQNVALSHFETTASFLEHETKADPRLILVDLEMADMKGVVWRFAGIEAVISLREKLGDAPDICILTGHQNPNFIGSSMANGANGFFKKALPLEQLAEEILDRISHKPARGGRVRRAARQTPETLADASKSGA